VLRLFRAFAFSVGNLSSSFLNAWQCLTVVRLFDASALLGLMPGEPIGGGDRSGE
jgi:hypothetical protein